MHRTYYFDSFNFLMNQLMFYIPILLFDNVKTNKKTKNPPTQHTLFIGVVSISLPLFLLLGNSNFICS